MTPEAPSSAGWRALVPTLALALALVAGACSSSPGSSASSAGHPASSTTSSPPPPPSTTTTTSRAEALAALRSRVTVVPADGAVKQSLKTVVTLRASDARLEDVKVRAPALSLKVTGHLDPSGDEWSSSGGLLPGLTYRVSFKVVGTDGLVAGGSDSFTTAPPAAWTSASVFPTPGIVVGVGEPIVVMFSRPVSTYAAQQAVLSRLQLAMSEPVAGGWHWFSSVELHFRPASYWPVGDQVQLSGDLNGWDVGGGEWGTGAFSTDFIVGESHISTVNLVTHEMTVTDNGQVVYDWPISAGAPRWPTMNGTHIVLDRDSVVHMDSATVGIPVKSPAGYNEMVYWDVHISDSGEYVHAAPWSVTEQGLENVSHGCVNLSPQRAETFFRFSRVGDVVNVINGPRAPVQGDHGVMDWSFGPSTVVWTPAKVALLTTTVATLPTTTLPPPAGVPYYGTTIPPNPTVPPAPTTTASTTTAPVTTAPVTTAPVTTAPVTTAPVTTAPVTTAPVTTAPPSTAPPSTAR